MLHIALEKEGKGAGGNNLRAFKEINQSHT